MIVPATVPRSSQTRPYPGMRPFQVSESDLFFGQDQQIAELLRRLGNARLIGVIGESGCGKSSLVKAGLISRLLGTHPDRRESLWRIAVSQPGRAPIATLAERLAAEGALDLPPVEVQRMLRSSSFGLAEVVKAAKLPAACRVLVVIDQFEELFRFCKESEEEQPAQPSGADIGRWDEAALFVKLLLALADHSTPPGATPAYVVLTMRSEYLGDCASFFGLAEAMNEGAYLLPKMTRSNIESAILGPLHNCGGEIDNDLLQDLLNETVQAHEDGLPLLQHALRRIWDNAQRRGALRLTREDVGDLPPDTPGRLLLEKLLNAHLDHIYDHELNTTEQRIAESLFRQLGEYDAKGRLVRRSRDFRTVAKVCGSPGQTLAVVDVFRNEDLGRTFLMPPREATEKLLAGQEPLDLSHEALLRHWERLGNWIRQEAEDAAEFRALADRVNRGSFVLRGRELRRASKWERQFRPTLLWAERYQGPWDADLGRHRYDYGTTMRYLWRSRVRRVWRGIGYGVLALVFLGVFFIAARNMQMARQAEVKQERQQAYRQADAQASKKYEQQLVAKNSMLTKAQTELTRLNTQLTAQGSMLKQRNAQLEDTTNKLTDALGKEKEAHKVADSERQTAVAAKSAADNLNTKLTASQAQLKDRNEKLKNAKDEITLEAARRSADFDFWSLAHDSLDYSRAGVARHLRKLAEAIRSFVDKYHQLPLASMTALASAVSLSYLSDSDTNSTDAVLLAMSDPSRAGHLRVLRTGAPAEDGGVKAPRQNWRIQHAVPLPDGQTLMVGGVGGYVAFPSIANIDKKSLVKAHKVHPFAITGLGSSADGRWVVTASSSGDMRAFRYADFASKAIIKDSALQIGNAIKLFAFLFFGRYAGDYPVYQFAVALVPHTGGQSEKRDLEILSLTESGRLVRWSRPGPFGKQLSGLKELTVATGNAPARAIATNPATQKVWAGANDSLGIVLGQKLVRVATSPAGVAISALSWNAGGSLLALGLRDGSLCIYQSRSGDPGPALDLLVRIPGHLGAITALSWRGDVLASGSSDGAARLWDLSSLTGDRPLLSLLAAAADSEERAAAGGPGLEKKYEDLVPYLNKRLEALADHDNP